MIESIIRDLLADNKGIVVVPASEADPAEAYDVLILKELDQVDDTAGYHSASPSAGIVMVGRDGRKAAVFSRAGDDLDLEPSTRSTLERAILQAAGQL